MRFKYSRKLLGVMFVAVIVITSCTRENEEDLKPAIGQPICDTLNVTFTKDVLPIITLNCYICHGNGSMIAGINLQGYTRIKRQVDNNLLLNVIKHSPGYAQMPSGQAKLAQCDIDKIEAWVKRGAIDN